MAVATYSAALPFAAGAVIAIAARPAGLRCRRAWVVAVPLVGYGVWRIWAAHYTQHPKLPFVTQAIIAPDWITKAPGRIGEAFAAGVSAATGLFRIGAQQTFSVNYGWGVPLAVLCVAAALVRLSSRRGPRPDRGAWAFVAMPLVYWAAVSVIAQRDPGTHIWKTRATNVAGYQYTSVVLLLLAAAALASGMSIPRLARLGLAAVLSVSLVANLLALHQADTLFRGKGPVDRAELAAVELVGNRAAPGASAVTDDVPTSTQFYLSSAAMLGSAATPASVLSKTTSTARAAADLTLIRLFGLAPRRSAPITPCAPPAQAPWLESGTADLGPPQGGCVSALLRTPGTPLSFRLPRGGFTVQVASGASVNLLLRRFMDPPELPIGSVTGGAVATVAIPTDASAQPWQLRLAPAQAVRLCAL